MSDVKNKKIVLGIGIIISFVLLIISISLFYNYQHDIRRDSRLTSESIKNLTIEEVSVFLEERRADEPKVQGFYILPFVAFIGVLVGSLVFYFMSEKIVHKDQIIKKNTKIILNFLSQEEKKVVETLIENEGRVQQYELSHLPGLNKVKTHRVLFNLEKKGVIYKERLGKINKIVLNKELFEVLK